MTYSLSMFLFQLFVVSTLLYFFMLKLVALTIVIRRTTHTYTCIILSLLKSFLCLLLTNCYQLVDRQFMVVTRTNLEGFDLRFVK